MSLSALFIFILGVSECFLAADFGDDKEPYFGSNRLIVLVIEESHISLVLEDNECFSNIDLFSDIHP